ncbi:hypothetical protein GQX74_015413 [Glossina fuscipes]|nr:hypothetical protein GQX74_015413 [Glossina fuscipes]
MEENQNSLLASWSRGSSKHNCSPALSSTRPAWQEAETIFISLLENALASSHAVAIEFAIAVFGIQFDMIWRDGGVTVAWTAASSVCAGCCYFVIWSGEMLAFTF